MKRLIYILSFLILLSSCEDEEVVDTDFEKELSIKITTSAIHPSIDHNKEFSYKINYELMEGDTVISKVTHPDWVTHTDSNSVVKGTPGWNLIDTDFTITIEATNLIDTVRKIIKTRIELGEIVCEAEFGASEESNYILPYKVGESYRMWQSYCHPEWSHKNWFSYDFDMPMGTDILASRAGRVIFERDHFEDGTRVSGEENFIFIEHEDGTVVHYVHLMKGGSLVEVGQHVEQGQIIGRSGDSGGSAGPHLHTTQFIGKVKGNYNFNRQYSIPMNYSNAEGKLNERNGLIIEEYYTATNYE